MIGILLKKQFMEIFRTYFYNAKTNKRRSTASTVMFIVLFALIMVGMLGGMFTALSIALCSTLTGAGLDWMYFALLSLIAIFLGAFGSVFNTYSGLYLARDNELLLSLPIPVKALIVSRLLGVYLMGLMYSGVVIVPGVIVYWIVAPFRLLAVLGGLLIVFLISVIVLILSCLLGWVVAQISKKLKNRSFIVVIVSLAFFGVYYYISFRAQSAIADLLENAGAYGDKWKSAAYPLYVFGKVGAGDGLSMLAATLVIGALAALTWCLLSRSFIGIATSSGASAHKAYKKSEVRVKGISAALLGRELSRFASSANYMLNCGLGTLFLPVLGIAALIKGGYVANLLGEVFGAQSDVITVLAIALICLAASMNDMATPSVSLEGKSLWILRSLPIDTWGILRAKVLLQLLLTGIPTLFCAVCLVIALQPTPIQGAFLLVIPCLYVVASAMFSLIVGLKWVNLNWTSEIVLIKQSFNVLLAMAFGWVFTAVVAVGGLFLSGILGGVLFFSLLTALGIVLCVLLGLWLRKKGVAVFEAL